MSYSKKKIMEIKSRREFIKLAGTAILVTSGISVFGLVSAKTRAGGEGSGNQPDAFGDGYYADGYYDDGYYCDGYYGDGYFCDGYYYDGYYYDGYYFDGYYDDGYYSDGYYPGSSTGFNEITNDTLKLVVSPNPSNGNFDLTMDGMPGDHCLIIISDLLGRTLIQSGYQLQQGLNRIPVQSGIFTGGTYNLTVITEGGRGSLRLLIAR